VSPEPDINITTLALCRLVLFALALKSAKPAYRLWRMYLPFRKRKPLANASLRQTKATTEENKIKTVLCDIDTRSPFAAPTSRGLPRTASAPRK